MDRSFYMDGEVPGGGGGAAESRGHRHVPGQQRRQRPSPDVEVLSEPHPICRQPWLLLAR